MKEIKVKVYDFKILDKTYYVYVNEENNTTQFYLQEKSNGIIEHQIGISNGDFIEKDFINENILEWVYYYNKEYGI